MGPNRRPDRTRGLARAFAAAAIAGALLAGAVPAAGAAGGNGRIFVFGAEGNRLNAYALTDGLPAPKQTVIPSSDDDPVNGLDINAQICFFPDGSRRFIAGEDTDQDLGRPQGWGIFQLHGEQIGEFSATEPGRLVPTYQPHQVSNVENYGCGFLSDGRVVTTDIGDQFPGFDGNGQLIVWFPPFDGEEIAHCKIDVDIATAGGIYVDEQDRVYVASNRPDTVPPTLAPAGVFRYGPPFPTSNDATGGCGRTDGTGAPLADAVNKELFIPTDAHAETPSAVARSAEGTFYVSSVFNGVIAEYHADGSFRRRILEPPPGETPPFSTGSPLGIAVDSAGTIYYADLGLGAGPPPGPVDGEGTEFRIRFADGAPQAPEAFDDGLDFPDGVGVLEIEEPAVVSASGHAHTAFMNGTVHVDLDVTDTLGDGAPAAGFVRYDEQRAMAFRCAGTPASVTVAGDASVVIEGSVACTRYKTAERFSLLITDNGINPPNQDAYDLTLLDGSGAVVYRFGDRTTVGLGDLTVTGA